MQALAVALMPRALALQRVVVLTPRALVPLVVVLMSREPARLLAFVPRALGLQPGPSYVCTAGSRHRCSDLLYGSEIDRWCRRAVLLLPRGGQNS